MGQMTGIGSRNRRVPRRLSDRRKQEAGFTLIEIVCVLAMVALLAAILLPRQPQATSRLQLESYAVQIAAVLKADRNVARQQGLSVATLVDAPARVVRSGSLDRSVRVADDVIFDALLPIACNGRPALSEISFFSTGMSCGGVIRLTRPGGGLEIRVNWLTGEVDIVAQDVS